MTEPTNENRCILAKSCASAGEDGVCVNACASFNAIHSVSGRHTLAGLPADYRLVTLDNTPVTEHAETLRVYVERMTKQFTGERVRSLYLASETPGTGKTTTAAALINEYIRVNYIGSLSRGIRPAKRPAFFFDANHWQTLFSRIHMAAGDRRETLAAEFDAIRNRAITAEFAVFDDVGVRSMADGFRGQLHDVINERVISGRPTVYTSNVLLADLPDVFDARLTDRVREQCVELRFTGASHRGVRK